MPCPIINSLIKTFQKMKRRDKHVIYLFLVEYLCTKSQIISNWILVWGGGGTSCTNKIGLIIHQIKTKNSIAHNLIIKEIEFHY